MQPMQWMNPELSLSTQANLEASLRAIRRDGPGNPEATAECCSRLLRQNVIQQAIIRSAARYILELETTAALAQPRPVKARNWWQRLIGRA